MCRRTPSSGICSAPVLRAWYWMPRTVPLPSAPGSLNEARATHKLSVRDSLEAPVPSCFIGSSDALMPALRRVSQACRRRLLAPHNCNGDAAPTVAAITGDIRRAARLSCYIFSARLFGSTARTPWCSPQLGLADLRHHVQRPCYTRIETTRRSGAGT